MSTITKITAPAKGANVSGEFGGVRLEFVDGVAVTTHDLNAGLRRYLERRGYTVTAEGTDAAPAAESPEAEEIEAEKTEAESPEFDPADHSVADVREYLEGADESERTRVLESERAGKARAGLIGGDVQ